jgi:hypothetical protein
MIDNQARFQDLTKDATSLYTVYSQEFAIDLFNGIYFPNINHFFRKVVDIRNANISHFSEKVAYICFVAYNYVYKKLREAFKTQPVFSRDELLSFFQKYEPDLAEATFTWRIFDLKKRNIIRDVKTGVYTLNNQQPFEPVLNNIIISISKLVGKQYDLHFCNIWDTAWLNEFVELQATTSMIILEVEKGFMDDVFFTLKDKGITEVFVKPDTSLIEKYVSEAQQPVIIKPFLSRSPIQSIEGIRVPVLEKILVDIYCDDQIYYAFQGNQLIQVYRNAVTRYSLNFSKLFNYAKRRSREGEIKNLLLKVLDNDLKNIIE